MSDVGTWIWAIYPISMLACGFIAYAKDKDIWNGLAAGLVFNIFAIGYYILAKAESEKNIDGSPAWRKYDNLWARLVRGLSVFVTLIGSVVILIAFIGTSSVITDSGDRIEETQAGSKSERSSSYGDSNQSGNTPTEESQEVANTPEDRGPKVKLEYVEKNFIQGRIDEQIQIKVRMTNNTEKPIKGVKSVITFKDVFGDDILSSQLKLEYETPVGPGKSHIASRYLDYNQFLDAHQQLKTADEVKAEFSIDQIVYSES